MSATIATSMNIILVFEKVGIGIFLRFPLKLIFGKEFYFTPNGGFWSYVYISNLSTNLNKLIM